MKIVTVVGARPQFIKAAAISRAIAVDFSDRIEEVLVHTGQHYDANMSGVFFDELGIPQPRYNLEVSGGHHGAMTGRMLAGVEEVLLQEKPDWLLVYGDTNSTLAGALAAVKHHIPIAHVEAGLRSFNMRMPEEVNRIISDRISTLLFCPTPTAVENLAAEGICKGVHNVGDVMFDVSLHYGEHASLHTDILHRLGLTPGKYALATCHRAENTDNPIRFKGILSALSDICRDVPVVLPLHPRTRKLAEASGFTALLSRITVIDPVPFLDMVALEKNARAILTDSGGVQKEAFFYKVPCITMRDETEWVETVSLGWNQLVGAEPAGIIAAFENATPGVDAFPYGRGRASQAILEILAGG